jgi:hypothetical protein
MLGNLVRGVGAYYLSLTSFRTSWKWRLTHTKLLLLSSQLLDRYILCVLETKIVMYKRPFGWRVGCEVIHIGTSQSVFLASQYWVDKLRRITSVSHLAPTNEIIKAYKLLVGMPPLKRKTFYTELISCP